MEYQKIMNLLDNAPNQLSKFKTKNGIEINDQSRGVYNVNSNMRFKTTVLRSNLCHYSDAYIGAGADAAERQADERDKEAIFKNCALLMNCETEIYNTETDNAKDINIVMLMFNSIKYSDNYSKTCQSLWQY